MGKVVTLIFGLLLLSLMWSIHLHSNSQLAQRLSSCHQQLISDIDYQLRCSTSAFDDNSDQQWYMWISGILGTGLVIGAISSWAGSGNKET